MNRYSNPTGKAVVIRAEGYKQLAPPTGLQLGLVNEPSGAGEFDRFEGLASKLVQVPKAELDEKREASRS